MDATDLRPKPVTISAPVAARLIDAAHRELRQRASTDANACFGYFPALAGARGIDCALPACRHLSRAMPAIELEQAIYAFNFVRLSLIRQRCLAPFRFDSDAATAISGNIGSMHERPVFRLLLKLSPTHARRLLYLDPNCDRGPLARHGGYLHSRHACANE